MYHLDFTFPLKPTLLLNNNSTAVYNKITWEFLPTNTRNALQIQNGNLHVTSFSKYNLWALQDQKHSFRKKNTSVSSKQLEQFYRKCVKKQSSAIRSRHISLTRLLTCLAHDTCRRTHPRPYSENISFKNILFLLSSISYLQGTSLRFPASIRSKSKQKYSSTLSHNNSL